MAATASSKDHCTVGNPAEGRNHCAQKVRISFMFGDLCVRRAGPAGGKKRAHMASTGGAGAPGVA